MLPPLDPLSRARKIMSKCFDGSTGCMQSLSVVCVCVKDEISHFKQGLFC